MKNMGRFLSLVAIVLLASSTEVQACAVCFGAKDDPVALAIGQSILFLLSCIILVIGSVFGFFIHLMYKSQKRARELDPVPTCALTESAHA